MRIRSGIERSRIRAPESPSGARIPSAAHRRCEFDWNDLETVHRDTLACAFRRCGVRRRSLGTFPALAARAPRASRDARPARSGHVSAFKRRRLARPWRERGTQAVRRYACASATRRACADERRIVRRKASIHRAPAVLGERSALHRPAAVTRRFQRLASEIPSHIPPDCRRKVVDLVVVQARES